MMNQAPAADFVSRPEAQEMAGVTKPTILRAIYSGALPAVFVAHRWLIRRVDAEAWAAGRRTERRGRPRRVPTPVMSGTEE